MASSEDGVAVELGNVFANLTYDDIEPDHRIRLTGSIVDVVGCGFAGVGTRQHRATRALLDGSSGASTVIGSDVRASAADATLVNATTAHVLTYDDRHRESSTHPGSMVVPAALAVGEAVGAPGHRVLAAVFAGYEAIGRLGSLRRGFDSDLPRRPTPVFGPIGCAVTAGMLMDLDGAQLANAMGYGANLSGGMSQVWADGTEEYAPQAGLAARNGVTAAELAREGLTAAPRTFEGEYGFYRAFFGAIPDDIASVSNPLDAEAELDDVYPKPVPACGMVVVPIQLTDRFREEILAGAIDRLVVRVSKRTENIPGCDYRGPFDTPTRALMSIPFGVASTIVLDGYSWDACAEHHDDPRIQDLVDRISIEYDESFSKCQTEITVHTNDGEMTTVRREMPREFGTDDVAAKFEDSVSEYRSGAETADLLETLRTLPDVDDVSDVLSGLGGR